MSHHSILYAHQNALIDCTSSMCDYNQAGLLDKATQVADFCWTLLDYGQAILEGIEGIEIEMIITQKGIIKIAYPILYSKGCKVEYIKLFYNRDFYSYDDSNSIKIKYENNEFIFETKN